MMQATFDIAQKITDQEMLKAIEELDKTVTKRKKKFGLETSNKLVEN